MSYRQVKIEFFIQYKNLKSEDFKFWTCVLDTVEKDIDLSVLTNNSKKVSIDIDDFVIVAKYSNFDGNVDTELKKRNAVFLTKNKESLQGSPYSDSCAELVNYYDEHFSIKFLEKIESQLEKKFSDYVKLEIQKQSINAIQKFIGINILNQESIPGSFSIYRRLPRFKHEGNYSIENGKRYIKFFFEPEENCSYLVEIEIKDNKKILYKQIHHLKTQEKIFLPERNVLEPFAHIHFSIFRQKKLDNDNIEASIIYEENCNFIISFNTRISVYGGNYKVVNNRFSNKIDKIIESEHINTYSEIKCIEAHQIENEYRYKFFRDNKNIFEPCLISSESRFFSNDECGRKMFLDWSRQKLQRAKEVIIIDPYFDELGFNDFNTCATSKFSLIIITTAPAKNPRKNQCKQDNLEYPKEIIMHSFPDAKVYYVDKGKLHDRFLIIYDGDDTAYYNMSNSWNGTVNNYSLLVQELPLSIGLQVKDCYSKYMADKYLQTNDTTKITENNKLNKNECYDNYGIEKKECHEDEYIQKKYEFIQKINETIEDEEFISVFTEFFYMTYKSEYIDEREVLELCIDKLQYVGNINTFIESLISKILNIQKKVFIMEQKILSNKHPINHFTDIITCLNTVSRIYLCGEISYDNLGIDYAMYKLLEACFVAYPSIFIKELSDKEKDICTQNIYMKTELKYYVSEQIISYMLSENFKYFPEQRIDDLIKFANKTENLYCKIYFAYWILNNNNHQEKFENRLNSLIKLNIDPDQLTILLGLFSYKLFRSNAEDSKEKREAIASFISKNYSQNKKCLISFALHAYFLLDKINFDEFRIFLDNNHSVKLELDELFLFSSLNYHTSIKLFSLLEKYVDKDLFSYLPTHNERHNIMDLKKNIRFTQYIGQTICEIAKNNLELKKNLIHNFNIYPKLIFEIEMSPSDRFDCYVLLIILHALNGIMQHGDDVTEEIKSIKWYIPHLLNRHGDDCDGLTLKILKLYTTFLTDYEKNELKNKLNSEKHKSFLDNYSTME